MTTLVNRNIMYKVHSTGKIGSWSIAVYVNDDDTATMKRLSCKLVGGTAVETVTHITTGKNIGRANETTPVQQAVSQMNSKVNKQLDKGYVWEMPEEGDKVTNAMGFLRPMLAKKANEVSYQFPVFASAKLDGHRMLATVSQGMVVLYSREGKEIKIQHIRDALQRAHNDNLWNGETLDGEVYLHGETLQRISSLVKKSKPESFDLLYHIYDIMWENVEYEQRKLRVDKIVMGVRGYGLELVDTRKLNNQEEVDKFHAYNLSRGYEGTMLRHSSAGYEDGKRSSSLLKKKDFLDDEFEIIGYEEGAPYIRDDYTYRVAVYICQTAEGNEFRCTSPGTMEEKDAAWQNAEQTIGKFLTVKYFNMTPDNVPFLPVALQIKEHL